MQTQYSNKRQAVEAAKLARAEGKVAKVYRHSGVYTQPGRGLAGFCYYTVTTK